MSLQPVALATERLKQRARAEPLQHFRCATWAGVEVYRAINLDSPPEIYWNAANMAAKTRSLTALDLAFLSGRDRLMDWERNEITIPLIEPPVAGGLIVPSYKLASGSVVAALRELLGDWPCHEGVISGAQDAIGIFYVQHRREPVEDWSRWSRLYLFPHEGEVPQALRLDFAHADEPPPERMWRAIRNRAKAGRPFYRYLGATPWDRRLWQWLRDDFPREAGRVVDGRLRLQSSVYDNRALSVADLARQEQANRGSPWARAALYGDHVDAAGSCPFDLDTLLALRLQCRDGARHVALELDRNHESAMGLREQARGEIEVWMEPGHHDRVLVLADPSSGIAGPEGQQKRHQAGLMAVSVAERALLLRFAGYLSPPELGLMARAVCNHYRDWIFVPEMNGGWGEELLRSFQASPAAHGSQGMVYQDVDPTSTVGGANSRLGWWQTANRRGALVAALQRALLERSLAIWSRAALENLMEVQLDQRDRYDQPGGGPHALDMILLGMACSIMENGYLLPPRARPPQDARERFEREFRVHTEPDYDGYAPDPMRWR